MCNKTYLSFKQKNSNVSTQKILIILGNIVILLALNEIGQNIESPLKKLSVNGFVFTCHLNALREAKEMYVRRRETTQGIITKERQNL